MGRGCTPGGGPGLPCGPRGPRCCATAAAGRIARRTTKKVAFLIRFTAFEVTPGSWTGNLLISRPEHDVVMPKTASESNKNFRYRKHLTCLLLSSRFRLFDRRQT